MDHRPVEVSVEAVPFSDDELTELAMAAEPITALAKDAVAWGGGSASSLLPDWYMPAPAYQLRGRFSRGIVVTLIVGFLVIDAFGLCITSGFLTWA
jgi:hypothetical protein